ncbi:MAG: tetratricopeptide repeat protein [Alistipes sp.]|nr:tetratricopeptide repeat protein [Alistipes sp.]MBR1995039.1 tetratricopeptide repeat protein [Alistipes sp.]MBR3847614.1 tetratricopeptide repeat protein [Alistipes sp.]
MAKKNVAEPETLGAAMNKTEAFFEKNGRKISYIFLILIALGLAIYGYRSLVQQPRVDEAAALLAEAQARFNAETPDYELALNGDEEGAGFLEVIEQYGSTPSGNLAKHYAGVCYLKGGDLEQAAAYLADYSAVKGLTGEIINAQNLGLQGDIAVAQEDYTAAVALFEKAVKASENNLTAPLYLRKAGQAAQAAGDNAKALELYERITVEYPASMEARDAEKLIGTIH